jgi:hypothetical protein
MSIWSWACLRIQGREAVLTGLLGVLLCNPINALSEGGRRQESGVVRVDTCNHWCRVLVVSPASRISKGVLNRSSEQPEESDTPAHQRSARGTTRGEVKQPSPSYIRKTVRRRPRRRRE